MNPLQKAKAWFECFIIRKVYDRMFGLEEIKILPVTPLPKSIVAELDLVNQYYDELRKTMYANAGIDLDEFNFPKNDNQELSSEDDSWEV